MLLSSPTQPHLAAAIEVKRVKFGAAGIRKGRPNKLKGFEKGIRQANLLARVGFSQAYLYVLVVIDSREQNAGNDNYSGLPTNLKAIIDNAIGLKDLDPRVGLVRFELVQPRDMPALGIGSWFLQLVRLSKPVMQSAELTERVRQLMQMNLNCAL